MEAVRQLDKPRFLTEIEVAKGIGILLVVIGHLVANAALGPDWYAALKRLIYQFHMPFFMYLSGFSFAWVRPFNLDMPFLVFLKKRGSRLLVPFVIFGAIIILAKYGAQFFLFVDDAPESLAKGFTFLFINTENSPALSIWYVFVLFIFSVFAFLVGNLSNRRLLILLIAALIMHFTNIPDILYMNRIFYFFLFFVLGMLAARNYTTFSQMLKRFGPFGVIIFLIGCGMLLSMNKISGESKLIAGLVSLPALHYVAISISGSVAKVFEKLGNYSFPIYLMNTLMIGGFKAIYIILMSSMTTYFAIDIMGAMIFGLLVPIVLFKITQSMWPTAAKFLK